MIQNMAVSMIIIYIYDDVSNSDNDCINSMTVIANDQIKKEMMLSGNTSRALLLSLRLRCFPCH